MQSLNWILRSVLRFRTAAVLSLSTAGLAGCGEETTSPSAPQPSSSHAAVASPATAGSPVFTQITVGGQHTCGLMGNGQAYCWGYSVWGQVGSGSTPIRTVRPTLVAGGLRFAQISAGTDHTCGVTSDNRAFCWGDNQTGQLGDGTTTDRSSPVAVAGGRRFRQIRAGAMHTCAVTALNVGFCWGLNGYAQLGDGTTVNRLAPVRVLGGHSFRRVIAGGDHTCGVTTGDRGYCWGRNSEGQLGDGTTRGKLKPVAVAGGLSFSQVIPGANHTCGVTTAGRGYCWGDNEDGQIGDGTQLTTRLTPVRVAGSRTFRQVIAGFLHTCGVTTSNVAFCWGVNSDGQNGNGNGSLRDFMPVRVAGGLQWSAVTTGVQEPPPFVAYQAKHSCGLTIDSRAYCWGSNLYGQVGDGTGEETTDWRRPTPVAVVGPA